MTVGLRAAFALAVFATCQGHATECKDQGELLDEAALLQLAISREASEQDATDWKDWGEVVEEAALLQPAISREANEQNNRADQTWIAGQNAIFEGVSLGEAKVRLGVLRNTDVNSFLPHQETPMMLGIESEFDWRTDPRAAKCPSLKEVRDQANCGSDWAFGAVEVMTDRLCIHSGGRQSVHLSAQDVTSCDFLGNRGCSGGIPSSVYTFWRYFGIVPGGNYGDRSSCWSYQLPPCAHHSTSSKYGACGANATAPPCSRKCVDDGKSWEGSKVRGAGGYRLCSSGTQSCADAMKQEIYQRGPITAMFFVKPSFLSYKSGVYQSKPREPALGAHAVKILGYGSEGGTPYWLVANSWNEDWGDQGFFKIRRGVNMDEIENPLFNGGPIAGMPK